MLSGCKALATPSWTCHNDQFAGNKYLGSSAAIDNSQVLLKPSLLQILRSRYAHPNAVETLIPGLYQVFAILPVYLFRSIIAKDPDSSFFFRIHKRCLGRLARPLIKLEIAVIVIRPCNNKVRTLDIHCH